jgi:hypothetical protein
MKQKQRVRHQVESEGELRNESRWRNRESILSEFEKKTKVLTRGWDFWCHCEDLGLCSWCENVNHLRNEGSSEMTSDSSPSQFCSMFRQWWNQSSWLWLWLFHVCSFDERLKFPLIIWMCDVRALQYWFRHLPNISSSVIKDQNPLFNHNDLFCPSRPLWNDNNHSNYNSNCTLQPQRTRRSPTDWYTMSINSVRCCSPFDKVSDDQIFPSIR